MPLSNATIATTEAPYPLEFTSWGNVAQVSVPHWVLIASDVRPRLVQSLGAQPLDGVVGFHLLPETLHNQGIWDDTQSHRYILLGINPGFYPHDLVALLASYCFCVSAISVQIPVGHLRVAMMNFDVLLTF